ncbi:MAG: NRDE family protein [bacterium]|nr:NRDE family protein [bacterium]
MCLILIAYQVHPGYKLVLAANRDEYYNRPAVPAGWWEDAPFLLAGKDLEAGGTWLGITKKGKIAALTNFRGLGSEKQGAPSRGALVSDYLLSEVPSGKYLEILKAKGSQYSGFNLIFGYSGGLYFYDGRGEAVRLTPGIHGLSNDSLDTPWPKVEKGKRLLGQHISKQVEIDPEAVFSILADTGIAPDHDLPDTGIGITYERLLSPLFIEAPGYGTRSSTFLSVDKQDRVTFIERSFVPPAENRYEFSLQSV